MSLHERKLFKMYESFRMRLLVRRMTKVLKTADSGDAVKFAAALSVLYVKFLRRGLDVPMDRAEIEGRRVSALIGSIEWIGAHSAFVWYVRESVKIGTLSLVRAHEASRDAHRRVKDIERRWELSRIELEKVRRRAARS